MITLESILDNYIENRERSIAENMEALNSNFLLEFEWRTEALLVDSIQLETYKIAKEFGFENAISQLQNHVSKSYNVVGTSTCPFRNIKTAIEFKTKMDLLDQLKEMVSL